MSRSIWYYRCDEGHEWKVSKELNDEGIETDTFCPFGHPAVTLQKCELVRQFEITIRPAEEMVDRTKNQTRFADRYYIVIRVSGESDVWNETMSQRAYRWEDAAPIVSHLLSMPIHFMLRHIQKY